MSEFKREHRYIVFKVKDLNMVSLDQRRRYFSLLREVSTHLASLRKESSKPPFNAVVVEQDWPEFDAVWESIEARMGDGLIQCTTCGRHRDPFLVRQRVVYKNRCFECAEAGRPQMWKKVAMVEPLEEKPVREHLTTDPTDPRLGHGSDDKPVPQNEAYLVLSKEERAKGFVRPLRRSYIHKGIRPKYPTRLLTVEEQVAHPDSDYVIYEIYPESESPKVGKFWTRAELNSGCGATTTMGLELCETYARDPKFYGATYCTGCHMHRPVAEFVWKEDGKVVGS